MSTKTESEEVFERYLEAQHLAWTRPHHLWRKHPDYEVRHGGVSCLFEVKEFDDPAVRPSGGYSPCSAIQEKIRQARNQFKYWKGQCCVLVLWNSKSIFRSVQPEAVASAAFGELIHMDASPTLSPGVEPPRYRFSGSAELTPTQNRTISAIAILTSYRLDRLWLETWREVKAKDSTGVKLTLMDQLQILQRLSFNYPVRYSYEGTIRTVVLENPFARIAFPPDLFLGPFDQRWRLESGWFSVAFLGSELDQLKRQGVPFIYL